MLFGDTLYIIQSFTYSFAHPLAVFFQSSTELYLYEHHPLLDGSASTGFMESHLGQLISLQ